MKIELNTIYNMDCLEGMKAIPDGSVDAVITDPPYGISYNTNRRKGEHKFKTEIANDDNFDFITEYINGCYRILKNDSACYMFCSTKTLPFFIEKTKDAGFTLKNIIVWDKGNWTCGDLKGQYGQQWEPLLLLNKGRKEFNGKRYGDVWSIARVSSDKLQHQNEKPLDLIRRCVLTHSDVGNTIFDGCMGSGTTAVACIKERRNYIGFELDEEYYRKSLDRIQRELSQPSLNFNE